MSKSLVIVESPAKAKTINKFLGSHYLVMACNGHIRDLPTNRLGVSLNNDFKPDYEIIKGKSRVASEIRKKATASQEVLLAADPDREGEAICWHLMKVIGNRSPIKRVLFNEITRKSIQEAVENPLEIDDNKVEAQQARRILDRLVGYMISPLLWTKVRAGLSAGRVQSVALRIICEREKEVTAFVPEEYWNITAELLNSQDEMLTAKLLQIKGKKAVVSTEAEAKKIVEQSAKVDFLVAKIERKKKQRKTLPPFTTSKLQQEGAQKLRFSPQKTMRLAQQLYEGLDVGEAAAGLITYMRTDSTRIASEAISECTAYIKNRYGSEYLPSKPKFYRNKKGAQDAHEAIRPTSMQREPEKLKQFLTAEQFKLYQLIWDRFVMSQMKNALVELTTVDIKNDVYLYRASGQVILFKGFLIVNKDKEENGDGFLPRVEPQEKLRLNKIDPSQHFTKPSPRFTDATLVKEMEENGIGRPSTYAAILEIIERRAYVKKEKRTFFPTEIGLLISELLTKSFPQILDIKFTAKMEDDLDEVETGNLKSLDLLKNFYDPFSKSLEKAKQEMSNVKKELEEETDIICEKCGAVMVTRWGRRGKFIACPNFPKCKNTKPLEENTTEMENEAISVDVSCEKCGGKMLIKTSRYGRFLACANFPKCKNSKPLPTGASCPVEGCDGYVGVMRSKKGRTYYGCSNYPGCKFRSWDKPVNQPCPQCESTYLVEKTTRKAGTQLICVADACDYKKSLSD